MSGRPATGAVQRAWAPRRRRRNTSGNLARRRQGNLDGTCRRIAPSEPTNLRTEPLGNTRLRVTWQRPSNGACVDEYRVAVTPVGGLQAARAAPAQPTTQFSVVIEGLQPGQTYSVRVEAFSRTTNSGASASTTATLPSTPGCNSNTRPGLPRNLRAQGRGPGTVHLEWEAPAGNACVTGYTVNVVPLFRALTAMAPRRTQGGSVDITNLTPGQRYRFEVSAEGPGGFSNLITVEETAPVGGVGAAGLPAGG